MFNWTFPNTFPIEYLNANHTSNLLCSTFHGFLLSRNVFKVAILISSVLAENEIIVHRRSRCCKNVTICPCGIEKITLQLFSGRKTYKMRTVRQYAPHATRNIGIRFWLGNASVLISEMVFLR